MHYGVTNLHFLHAYFPLQETSKGGFRQGVGAKKRDGVQGIHSSHWWRGWDSPLQVYTMTWGQLTDNVFYSSLWWPQALEKRASNLEDSLDPSSWGHC